MKGILKTVAVVAALVTGISSCTTEKDPCETVVCQNGGQAQATGDVCSCNCPAGTEGDSCQNLWSTKFLGTYNFSDACPSGTYTGTATITSSSNNLVTVLVSNFGGIGASATLNGTLQDANTIVISSGSAGGYTISNATGTYNNGIITWNGYVINDGTSSETCTSSIWTKQ